MMELLSYVKYHNELRTHLRAGFRRLRLRWKKFTSTVV
jgi:hypothetical protein